MKPHQFSAIALAAFLFTPLLRVEGQQSVAVTVTMKNERTAPVQVFWV